MLIGNIGIGLFVLITVWILALIIFVFGIKFQNNIAWISLSIAATFTIILVVLPVSKPTQSSETVTDHLDKDYIYIYQVVLLALLIVSLVLGCIFFFILHCVEPVRPKAVKLLYM